MNSKNSTNIIETHGMACGPGSHIVLLVFLVLLAYSNTFHSSWHLDDITNILDNNNVHVSTLSFSDWAKSIRPPFTDPSNPKAGLSGIYRPVAMITFAFNWYLGGANVLGYHLVNIGIHCVNSVLLFLTILSLLRAPNLSGRYQGSDHFIALFATALWALHPIQTQAITYLVQRMASLATLFYLGGIFMFIKGRTGSNFYKKNISYGVCLIFYFLAMGSKQNAVTLPVVLLLIEIIFFADPDIWKRCKAKWMGIGTIIGLVIFLSLLFWIWQKNPVSSIINGYQSRHFTMLERLLTEPRILIFHLYQIFYPVPDQFSILHDISLSKSIVDPWTTVAAISLIGVFLLTAFYGVRRKALLSFSIIFYFIGHSVESTFIPLELIFEHRNYLPTLFIFLPVACGLKSLIDNCRGKNKILSVLLLAVAPILIAGLTLGTYTRNIVWGTEKSLWTDTIQKAPSLARPYQNLALAFERRNRTVEALNLYRKALDLKDPDPMRSRFISLSNMGNIYKKRNDIEKAVQYLTAATRIETGPYILRTRYNLALCLLNGHKEKEALEQIELLLARQKNNARFLNIKGFLLFRQGKLDLALRYIQMGLKQNPYDKNTLINLAMVLSSKGYHERSEWFLNMARKRYPENMVIYLALLQNALQSQDTIGSNKYLYEITSRFQIDQITSFLIKQANGYHYIDNTLVPVNGRMLLSPLADFIKQTAEKIDTK